MRRYSFARGFCHERNTALRDPLQLLDRILRKRLAGLVLDDLLVARRSTSRSAASSRSVSASHAARLLHGLELVLEHVLRNLEDDVAEHLDEAAVAVGGEPAVAGLLLQRLDGLVVEAEVENRVHHAGHRELRARPHRHEQRLLRVAQLAAGRLLELAQVVDHLLLDRRRESCRLPCSRWCRRGVEIVKPAAPAASRWSSRRGPSLCRRAGPSSCDRRRPCRRRSSRRTCPAWRASRPSRFRMQPWLFFRNFSTFFAIRLFTPSPKRFRKFCDS